MEDQRLREILGIGEGEDALDAVRALKADSEANAAKLAELQGKVDSAEAEKTGVEAKLKEGEADAAAQGALNAGKITPKQADWAKAYALKDPDGFKAFVETAETVGPDLTVRGSGQEETIRLTEKELEVAKRLGVSEEGIVALKKADEEAG